MSENEAFNFPEFYCGEEGVLRVRERRAVCVHESHVLSLSRSVPTRARAAGE